MKYLIIALSLFLLTGCANTRQFELYLEAQRALNRDATVTEAARINALKEIVAETQDSAVKLEAIRSLQQIQRNQRYIILHQPKKNLFGF